MACEKKWSIGESFCHGGHNCQHILMCHLLTNQPLKMVFRHNTIPPSSDGLCNGLREGCAPHMKWQRFPILSFCMGLSPRLLDCRAHHVRPLGVLSSKRATQNKLVDLTKLKKSNGFCISGSSKPCFGEGIKELLPEFCKNQHHICLPVTMKLIVVH